jgi:hypothetical protein
VSGATAPAARRSTTRNTQARAIAAASCLGGGASEREWQLCFLFACCVLRIAMTYGTRRAAAFYIRYEIRDRPCVCVLCGYF